MNNPTNTSITNPALGASLSNMTGVSFLQSLLPNLITLALVVGVIVFLFILIIGAIQWISSGGDKQALEGARGKITNGFVGLIILFSVFAVIKLIEVFFRINILALDIGSLFIR